MMRYLVGQGLEALDEREDLNTLFIELDSSDTHKKVVAGQALHKRAKKAYMGRVPDGALTISSKQTHEATPLEIQFGTTKEKEPKKERIVLPWHEPVHREKFLLGSLSLLKMKPSGDVQKNVCCP